MIVERSHTTLSHDDTFNKGNYQVDKAIGFPAPFGPAMMTIFLV
jgi:hypothetical protein